MLSFIGLLIVQFCFNRAQVFYMCFYNAGVKHKARCTIHDLDETIILNQPDFLLLCKKNYLTYISSERGEMSRNNSGRGVDLAWFYIDEPMLGTKYDWHAMVPEGNTHIHTQGSSVETDASWLSRVISLMVKVDRLT